MVGIHFDYAGFWRLLPEGGGQAQGTSTGPPPMAPEGEWLTAGMGGVGDRPVAECIWLCD